MSECEFIPGALISGTLRFAGKDPGEPFTLGRPSEPVTPEACVQAGGHCWVDQDRIQFQTHTRLRQSCKHCAVERHGISREPWNWDDPQVPR